MYLENLFKKTFMDPASDSSLNELASTFAYRHADIMFRNNMLIVSLMHGNATVVSV